MPTTRFLRRRLGGPAMRLGALAPSALEVQPVELGEAHPGIQCGTRVRRTIADGFNRVRRAL